MPAWNVIYALHLLGVGVWLGGSFAWPGLIRPIVRLLDPSVQMMAELTGLARLMNAMIIAAPMAIVTGWLMLFGFYGLLDAGWSIHLMHLLGLGMAGLFAMLWRGPWQALHDDPHPAVMIRFGRYWWIMTGFGSAAMLAATATHFG